jgi:hypothetical protein
MSSGDWKDLQADIRKSLKIGQKNGETLIDVVTRIVWLERHKNQIRIMALNQILKSVDVDPAPERRAPMRAVDRGNGANQAIRCWEPGGVHLAS